MANYLLGVIQPTGGTLPPDELEKVMARVGEVDQAMRDAGAWVFAGGLADPGSTTVLRAQDGDVVMTDGPYAEGKEFLGGFTVIAAEDLDEALVWGRRLAVAIGLPIEVRPFRW
jgi:hypothetical protein